MKVELDVRAGYYRGGIRELIKILPEFQEEPSRVEGSPNYYSEREAGGDTYTIMVSETARLLPRFNIQITVNGPSKDVAERLMKDFVGEIGMETEEDKDLKEAFYLAKRISGARKS